jgi:hypothetical protein
MNESEEANRMDCGEFEEVVHDLDRPGTQGLELRETALIHAESCGQCGRLMTEAESLDYSLQTLAAHDIGLQAPPRIEASLIREFRLRKAASSRRRMQWGMAALGTAAAALLTLGISLRHSEALGTKPQLASSLSGEVGAKVSGTSSEAIEVAENQSKDSENVTENATAFVSLPYATDPETLEGGSVVRVLLSRPALASLGLPVANMGATEQIPADIVLSEDGAPQAIRLVSQAQADYSMEPVTASLASWGGTNEPQR